MRITLTFLIFAVGLAASQSIASSGLSGCTNASLSTYTYTLAGTGVTQLNIIHNLPTFYPIIVNTTSSSTITFLLSAYSTASRSYFSLATFTPTSANGVTTLSLTVPSSLTVNNAITSSSTKMSYGLLTLALVALFGIAQRSKSSILFYAVCFMALATFVHAAATCNFVLVSVALPSNIQMFCENGACRCVNGYTGATCGSLTPTSQTPVVTQPTPTNAAATSNAATPTSNNVASTSPQASDTPTPTTSPAATNAPVKTTSVSPAGKTSAAPVKTTQADAVTPTTSATPTTADPTPTTTVGSDNQSPNADNSGLLKRIWNSLMA